MSFSALGRLIPASFSLFCSFNLLFSQNYTKIHHINQHIDKHMEHQVKKYIRLSDGGRKIVDITLDAVYAKEKKLSDESIVNK